jgi:hypothetical protein
MNPNYLRNLVSKKIIFAFVVVGLLLISLVLYLNRPSSVYVSAEQGSDLFVATSKGGEFKKIGTTNVTYKTKKLPSDVYFMATHDTKKTISGVSLKKGDKKSLTLTLANKAAATQIADEALSNVYLDGTVGQGIVSDEFTLVNFETNKDVPVRPEFAGLPYMKKIVWYDANNFVYSSFRQGVGSFINGVPLYQNGIGVKIFNKDGSESDEGYDDEILVDDISKSPKQPLVLASPTNIYLSNDMGNTLRSIIVYDSVKGITNSLHATDSHIYRHSGEEPASYASEEGSSDKSKEVHSSKLYEYDYSGKETNTITIPDTTIRAITETSNKTYVLTPNNLLVIDNGAINTQSLYFNFARDITTYKNNVVLLGDSGIWKVGEDGLSLQLLYEFNDGGVGLAKSFSTSNDTLIFSTQRTTAGSGNTRMYGIRF